MAYSRHPNHPSPADTLQDLMGARRHLAPRRLVGPGPGEAELQRIWRAAATAPDHGRLCPWRFVLIPGAKRAALGKVFQDALLRRDPACDEAARQSAHEKAFHAPCLAVAVLCDDAGEPAIPREEKLVSLGCAIQNMLLAAQSLGLASGLASGAAMNDEGMRALLRLAPHEQAICFIAFGTASRQAAPQERPRPEGFVSSL